MIMDDNELFEMTFMNLSSRYRRLTKTGTIVYYDGKPEFNTDGFNLAYNLLRTTMLLDEHGEFR